MRVSRSYPPVAAPPRGCKSHPGDVKDMPEAGLIHKAKQEALSWLGLRAWVPAPFQPFASAKLGSNYDGQSR